MDETQKKISLFKDQLDKLMKVTCASEFDNWQTQTGLFISRVYGEKSVQFSTLTSISPSPGSWLIGKPVPDETTRAKTEAISFLDGVITELETFGLPNSANTQGKEKISNININNNISQNQNIELNFAINTIKNELPPARLKEIEDIMSKEEHQEIKLEKIGNVLKKAGVEVLSSTLAKIITQATGIPVA